MSARPSTARLFVAVVPPLDVIEALDGFLEPRRVASTELRWASPESFHVTLAFCPHVPRDRVEYLSELLTPATRVGEFRLRLMGAGAFPHAARAKVLWQGVHDPADALAPLTRRVRGAANRAGGSPDGAAFSAHLTVARSAGVQASRWLSVLSTFTSREWTVDTVHLIESWLGQGPRGRSRYEVVETFAVSGPARSPETPARR